MVLEGHRDLPTTSVGIYHIEDGRLPNRVDTIVHPGEGARVLDREVVEQTDINTKSRGLIRRKDQTDREGLFGVRRLDGLELQLLLDLLIN